MKSMLINISRVLLAIYFLLPGISKFIFWDMHIALMETHNMIMVPFLLAITGVIQVIGGIFMLLNRQVVICALVFAAMVLFININLHDFWNIYEGVDARHETQNFVKNLGILAGLLALAAVNIKEDDLK
tara:strand:- start:934 stop:1320 length:387 start_codon:yes stop_codon:yes gene_type:complete